MHSLLSARRSLLAILMTATPTLVAGCDDDPAAPGPEPEFNRVEYTLTSGTTTRVDTVTTTGTQTGTRTFPAGTTTVTITDTRFLKPDGTVDAFVTPAAFELRGSTGGTTGVTFALTQGESFKGTIAGLTGPGERSIMMVLWHKVEGHEDFAQLLRLTIQ
jgi:hypothetical protein